MSDAYYSLATITKKHEPVIIEEYSYGRALSYAATQLLHSCFGFDNWYISPHSLQQPNGALEVISDGYLVGMFYKVGDAPKAKDMVKDGCPKCHSPGEFRRTALVCGVHGIFGGF